MRADQIFRDQWDVRDNIHKKVHEEQLKAKAKVSALQLNEAFSKARKHRQFIEEEKQ